MRFARALGINSTFLVSPLDTMSSFLKLQLVMRVVKGTACNMVRLMVLFEVKFTNERVHRGGHLSL